MKNAAQAWCPPVLDSGAEKTHSVEVDDKARIDMELKRARELGYSEGLEHGRRDGQAETAAAAAALDQLLKHLTEPVAELEPDLERAILALAVEIARRVVLHEISVNPAHLQSILRECLRHVPVRHGLLRLRVSPADYEILLANAVELSEDGLEVLADSTLSHGGCVLEVASAAPVGPDRDWQANADDESGEVDARIERRWRQVLAALFDEDLIQ